MPDAAPQDLASHARYVPGYHFVLSTLLLLVLGWAITNLVRAPGVPTALGMVLAISLILMYWYMRVFAVTVQDRVIRLEERLRMASLFPADLQHRIPEFSPEQLVALRFASDSELPTLARRVLDERVADAKAIKRMVREWRADHLRA
jgi:hypothetical protein